MNIEVTLVNAFTANGKGGNPAGVVFNADALSYEQKLKIAQAVGYSETAFVSSDEEADYEVSFFTTTDEVDFCGHATLATFSTLFEIGDLQSGSYLQRTKAGVLSVAIEANGKVIMEQQSPQKLGEFSYNEISKLIDIDSSTLATTHLPIEVISTGLSDVIIAVPTGYLDSIQPNDEVIADFCKLHNLVGLHVFELSSSESKFDASCRNFAPLFGISEESATGSSSGALACYLTEHLVLNNNVNSKPDSNSGLNLDFNSGLDLETNYVFEQGRAMNCTSIITASVKSNKSIITNVKVGGFAKVIGTMKVCI
jgi:PhzF family phenazine biosynthesis protein